MIQDELVEILGVKFPCVDKDFGENKPVDVVIRPEDVEMTVIPENVTDIGSKAFSGDTKLAAEYSLKIMGLFSL